MKTFSRTWRRFSVETEGFSHTTSKNDESCTQNDRLYPKPGGSCTENNGFDTWAPQVSVLRLQVNFTLKWRLFNRKWWFFNINDDYFIEKWWFVTLQRPSTSTYFPSWSTPHPRARQYNHPPFSGTKSITFSIKSTAFSLNSLLSAWNP